MRADAFRDQVVIITGASAGIGRSMAIKLAGQGARLSIAARRMDRLQQVADECRSLGADVLTVPTDVSVEEQCMQLIEKTVQHFGRIDMLVNNAGLAVTALFNDLADLKLFRHTMDVNFYGAVQCTYYALPYLKQTKGRLVAVSSAGGKATLPYNTPYCASKFGLHGFFDSLRMELYKDGVSITIICPWWVATEFHTAQMNKDGVPRGVERGRDMYSKSTMSPDRCAEITLHAAYKRRREVWMGIIPLAVWLKILAPGFLDWLTIKIFLEPVIRRAKAAEAKRKS